MELAWCMTETGHRLAIDAPPKFTNVGLGSLPGVQGMCPVISLMYELSDLKHLIPSFLYMKERGLSPEVYLWELEAEEPELMVRFLIPTPDRKVLGTLVGDLLANMTTEVSEEAEKFELLMASAGNADKVWTGRFLREFRRTNSAIVLITEAQEQDDCLVEPFAVFTTERVCGKKPPHPITDEE